MIKKEKISYAIIIRKKLTCSFQSHHVALSLSLGSHNSVYLARLLQSLDSYFVPLRYTKHQIYANVIRHFAHCQKRKGYKFYFLVIEYDEKKTSKYSCFLSNIIQREQNLASQTLQHWIRGRQVLNGCWAC